MRKRKIPPSKARYAEMEPTVSLHMPRQIKEGLMEQSRSLGVSLSQLLLSIITNQQTAAEAREKMVKYLLKKGQAQGYIECKNMHEETKNCTCSLCTRRKFEFMGLKIPQHLSNQKK